MARTGAIVIRWDRITPGREALALTAFGETLGYHEELAKEGRIIGHREYFAGGGQEGFMLLEGLVPELHQIVQEDDFLRSAARGAAVVDNLRIDVFSGGSDQTVQELVTMGTEVQQQLGLL
jgi:hypothetical protein